MYEPKKLKNLSDFSVEVAEMSNGNPTYNEIIMA